MSTPRITPAGSPPREAAKAPNPSKRTCLARHIASARCDARVLLAISATCDARGIAVSAVLAGRPAPQRPPIRVDTTWPRLCLAMAWTCGRLARSISGGATAGEEASMCRIPQAVATALLLLVPGLCAAQSVNMGSTFHGLEARARRVTTTFPDVVDRRAARRRPDDGGGASEPRRVEGGRLQVSAASRRVQWRSGADGDRSMEFALPEQAIVGLDWAAFQLYALHADAEAAQRRRARCHGRRRRVGRSPAAQPACARARPVCRTTGGACAAGRNRVRRASSSARNWTGTPVRTIPASASTTRVSPRRSSTGRRARDGDSYAGSTPRRCSPGRSRVVRRA